MARFYANENFPLPVVLELRRLGHDVLTVRESGKANRAVPDGELLDYATSEKPDSFDTKSKALYRATPATEPACRNRSLHDRYGFRRPGTADSF